jgi:hypothetical protein
MRLSLRLHPDSHCPAVTQINVDIARPHARGLMLNYAVTGRIADVSLPSVTLPARAEELWQHTCFEAFVRCPASAVYYEFNFAPSTKWATYQFDSYRHGMRAVDGFTAPMIAVQTAPALLTLQASLELGQLSRLPSDARWCLGLSALIEEVGGRKSYWALAHPPGKADFHHPDCFAYGFSPT